MSGLVSQQYQHFIPYWQGSIADYVTALDWSPNGQFLAAASGVGDLCLLDVQQRHVAELAKGEGESINCLAFSPNGKFLAVAGQQGGVKIWKAPWDTPTLVNTIVQGSAWIDRLAWNPIQNDLAIQMDRKVQIWNADYNAVIDILNLAATAQDLQWHPHGKILITAVKNDLFIWHRDSGKIQYFWEMMAPSSSLAWSLDGAYLAAGGLDRTLLVWPWGNDFPWQMQGFPGKVSQIVWASQSKGKIKPPLLAATSIDRIVVWQKDLDEQADWQATPLEAHDQKVWAIAFQPQSELLATAAEDGLVCLWHQAKTLIQQLEGTDGFSALAWHPQGVLLAAGAQNGDLLLWARS